MDSAVFLDRWQEDYTDVDERSGRSIKYSSMLVGRCVALLCFAASPHPNRERRVTLSVTSRLSPFHASGSSLF